MASSITVAFVVFIAQKKAKDKYEYLLTWSLILQNFLEIGLANCHILQRCLDVEKGTQIFNACPCPSKSRFDQVELFWEINSRVQIPGEINWVVLYCTYIFQFSEISKLYSYMQVKSVNINYFSPNRYIYLNN